MKSEHDSIRTRRRGLPVTKLAVLLAATLGAIAIFAPALTTLQLRLVWNVTASAPVGLYRIESPRHLETNDLVVVTPPEKLAAFLDGRGYLPRGVPLLKHIAALSGQTVCRSGPTILIDGRSIGAALEHDRAGRDLPQWQGCRRLSDNEVFLMNASVPDSLDGRYFGPTPRQLIIGTATALWTYD